MTNNLSIEDLETTPFESIDLSNATAGRRRQRGRGNLTVGNAFHYRHVHSCEHECVAKGSTLTITPSIHAARQFILLEIEWLFTRSRDRLGITNNGASVSPREMVKRALHAL